MLKRITYFFVINIAIVLTISIVAAVFGFDKHFHEAGVNYANLAVFCLIWGFAGSFISLYLSKWLVKWTMGVRIIDPSKEHKPSINLLIKKTHYLAKQAGLQKMPEIGVYQAPELNAFATGPNRNNSLIAVSASCLELLDEEELEGILGHEVAHIRNGDMVTMTFVQGIMNAFVMFFARIAAFALQNFLRGEDDDELPVGYSVSYHISVYVFQVLFGFLAMFVVSYFSRIREYRADWDGANLVGKEKMIKALKALQNTYDRLLDTPDNVRSMKISSKRSFMDLLSTHPPLQERISRLENVHNINLTLQSN